MKMGLIVFAALGGMSLHAANEFELYNDTAEKVWFDVKNGDTLLHAKGHTSLQPFKYMQDTIDTTRPTTLTIWKANPMVLRGRTRMYRDPYKIYSLSEGRNLYVTWGSRGIRPQRGKLFGVIQKTEGGLKLENVIKQNQITAQTSAAHSSLMGSSASS